MNIKSRSRHSVSNIIAGGINRILGIFLPFIMRTIIIKELGEEYLGINSLFASILQVLNFAELGLGNAIAANMYKSIAEKDSESLCALLNFYRKWYRIIGYAIIAFGVVILPMLPSIISGDAPEGINIYILFILYVMQTTISYLFWAYKRTLITAHQRMDVVEHIGIICKLIAFILQIIAIIVFKDILFYVIANIICIIFDNILCKHIADRDYPLYQCKGKLPNNIKTKIRKNILALSFQKIGMTASNSISNIIISAFLGLELVAIYGNYYYIMMSAGIFIQLIYSGITASVGNSIAVNDIKKNYIDFCRFSFFNLWVVGWCSICSGCLCQPFMHLWMGDKLMLPIVDVVLFAVLFYTVNIRRVVMTYKDAAGIWYPDKYRPLVGCIVNLSLSLFLVKHYAISGILIAAIISNFLVEFPWETYILFRIYFKKSYTQYYSSLIKCVSYFVFVGTITYFLCEMFNSNWLGIIARLLICLIVPNMIMYIVYRRSLEYQQALILILKVKNIIFKNGVKTNIDRIF